MYDWTTEEFIQAEVKAAAAKDPSMKLEDMLELKAQLEDEQKRAKFIWLAGNSGGSKNKLLLHMNDFHNDKLLYGLITSVYTGDGYGFPRSIIIKAKSIAKNIPEEERLTNLPAGDPVTIYRADSASDLFFQRYPKAAPSWTINKNVAIWFAYRLVKGALDHGEEPRYRPLTLWKATIPRNKIIAYLTERGEYEVLQHNNAQHLEILPAPTKEEIDAAFAEHEAECKKGMEELNAWARENGYHEIPIE